MELERAVYCVRRLQPCAPHPCQERSFTLHHSSSVCLHAGISPYDSATLLARLQLVSACTTAGGCRVTPLCVCSTARSCNMLHTKLRTFVPSTLSVSGKKILESGHGRRTFSRSCQMTEPGFHLRGMTRSLHTNLDSSYCRKV